jgi:ribosomal protein S18 acetylase RimI-like enzyme
VESEAAALHDALVAMWGRLYEVIDGARFEVREDYVLALCPAFPIPQCNGPWITNDTDAAASALPGALAEVESAGATPWVQTRAGHTRAQEAAHALGLTHEEHVPGMILRPGELVDVAVAVDIDVIEQAEIPEAAGLLAAAFETAEDLFERFAETLLAAPATTWYVGRVDGELVSTSLGFTIDGATGIFNVATPPGQRGRGYGAALTARAVRDGFDAGSELVYLQSSELGHGVYRRLGFRDVEDYVLLTRPG